MAQAMLDMNLKQDIIEWNDTDSDISDDGEIINEIINTKNKRSLSNNTCTTIIDNPVDFVQIIRTTCNNEKEVLFQYKQNYIDMQFYLEFTHKSDQNVISFLSKKCNYKAFDLLPYAKFSKAKQFFSIKTPQGLLKIDSKVCNKIKSRSQYHIDFGDDGNLYVFTLEFDTVDTKYIFVQHEYRFTDEVEYFKSINILYDNFRVVADAPSIHLPERTDKNKKKGMTLVNNTTMLSFELDQLAQVNILTEDIKYEKKITPDIHILPIDGKILNEDMFDPNDNCAHLITKIEHVQTRSGDEQATAIVKCIDCGIRLE